MNSTQQINLRNPQTLKDLAIMNYGDDNLMGWFCELIITSEYKDLDQIIRIEKTSSVMADNSWFDGALSSKLAWSLHECMCIDDYDCGCEYALSGELLRRLIYNNEFDFETWKTLVWKFISQHCPQQRYGIKFCDNYLYISPHFYLIHMDWFKKWNAVSSNDECRALLRRKTLLLECGDVESNPGPMKNQQHLNEVALRKKIEALERARERQAMKNKTLVRKMRQLKKQQFRFQGLAEKVNSPVGRSVLYGLANMVIPGTGTAAATAVEGPKLVRLLEKTNISVEHMQQAMDAMKEQVPTAISKHMVMTDLASTTLSTVNDILEQLKGGMSQVANMFVGLKDKITSMNPITLVLSIIMCFVVVSLPTPYLIGPILLLMAYLFGWHQSVIAKVKQILDTYKWFEGWQFQDGEDKLIPFVGQIIFTLLAFFGISQIPTDKFYDSLLRRLDIIPKACAGVGKIWNAAGDTYRAVEMEFKVFFLGKDRERLIDEEAVGEEVSKWVKRVDHYMQVKNLKSLSKDSAAVEEVTMLFDQMSRWKYTREWSGLSKEAQRIVDALVSTMTKLYSEVLRSSVHEGGPRIAPLSIMLSGAAGRGKSQTLIPLSYALLHGRNHKGNFKNEIYLRNYETEYWDGYCNQLVVHFDDAFQVKDSIAKPSAEFMEAIRINNVAPCHVHCADLKDKGRFFSSEICIYTTNLNKEFKKYIVSLNCPEAALRRLNMNAFEVLNKPEFESELPDDSGKIQMRLDKEKVKQCKRCLELAEKRADKKRMPFCSHLYLFQKYNIVTDQQIGKPMDYDEFVQYLLEIDKTQRTIERDLLEQYEILEDNPFAFQSGDDDHFFDAAEYFEAEEIGHELALDLSVPTDFLAYHQLQCFYLNFEKFARERDVSNWQERLISELAYDPQNYATYQRISQYGVKNKENPNKSLIDAMPDICYNVDAGIFMRSKHYPTWKVLRDSFYAYCSRLGASIKYIWDNSAFSELLSFGYMSLVMLACTLTIYRKFTAKDRVCFRCDQEEAFCSCVNILSKFGTEAAMSSGEVQQVKQAQLKTESAGSSGDHAQQKHHVMKTEAAGSSGDHIQQKQHSMKTEAAGSSGEYNQQKQQI